MYKDPKTGCFLEIPVNSINDPDYIEPKEVKKQQEIIKSNIGIDFILRNKMKIIITSIIIIGLVTPLAIILQKKNYYIEMDEITSYPFSLVFSENRVSPSYLAFESGSIAPKIVSINEGSIVKQEYTSRLQRKIGTKFSVDGSASLMSKIIGSISGGLDSDFSFSQEVNSYFSSVSLIIKKRIASLQVEKIKVKKFIEDKVKLIANSNYLTREQKIKEFYDYFSTFGFFIPYEITFGGRFDILCEASSQNTLDNFNAKAKAALKTVKYDINAKTSAEFDSNYQESMTDFSYSINSNGGGHEFFTEFEDIIEWYNSLRPENYGIVSFSSFGYIWDHFSEETKIIFDSYKQDVKNLIDIGKEKYDTLTRLGKTHPKKEGDYNWKTKHDADNQNSYNDGIYSSESYIEYKHLKAEEESFWHFFCSTKTLEGNLDKPSKIIVGWELYPRYNRDNGDFWINDDPIMTNNFDFHFKNCCDSRMYFDLYIYYIDLNKKIYD